jgi:cell division protein ZapE
MGADGAGGLGEVYRREMRARGFAADAAQLSAVQHLDDLRRRLSAPAHAGPALRRLLQPLGAGGNGSPERGLYLWGAVGRGKTWLMDLFYQSLPFPERRRRHFHRFMQEVHGELKKLRRRRAPLEHVAARFAAEARVLCFDELYVTDIADAMILAGLFAALFERGVTLVATSNVPPSELYRDGLQRQRFLPAIELIERHTEVLAVDGGVDYRLRRLESAGTYLPCEDAGTAARLAALFEELTEGASTGGSIEIEGRPIPVVRAGDNAVWFEFEALCAGARSTADYIEIAREYQCVIVANVPVLDEYREDAARRFIALVDELYDRGVNLIVSAAAAPPQLYRGERLRGEFQRTQSRLIEMQTTQYLAREHRP